MELPPELAAAFAIDPVAEALFAKLRPKEREELADFVAGAKRPETRVRRGHKVGEILKGRADRRADREERGVADLGKRFDVAMRAAVTEVLRPAGFANAKPRRTWRRIGVDRVEVLLAHRHSTDPEVGVFVLYAEVAVLRLVPDRDPAMIDGGGYQLHPFGRNPVVEVDGAVTEDALRLHLVEVLTTIRDAFDAVDVSTLAGVEAIPGAPVGSPALAVAFGDLEEAARRLRTYRPPHPFGDPADHPDPRMVALAEEHGLDPSLVPAEPPGGFIAVAPVQDRLAAAFGDQLLSAQLGREDRLHVRLRAPAPSAAEVAVVGGVPEALLQVDELTRSTRECWAIEREVAPHLVAREREIDELVVYVALVSDGIVLVAHHNLDAETEALVRAFVPADVLVLTPDIRPYVEAKLMKRERLG